METVNSSTDKDHIISKWERVIDMYAFLRKLPKLIEIIYE